MQKLNESIDRLQNIMNAETMKIAKFNNDFLNGKIPQNSNQTCNLDHIEQAITKLQLEIDELRQQIIELL